MSKYDAADSAFELLAEIGRLIARLKAELSERDRQIAVIDDRISDVTAANVVGSYDELVSLCEAEEAG